MTPDDFARFDSEASAKEALSYPDYRAWWAVNVMGLEVPKTPEPATLDVQDPELG